MAEKKDRRPQSERKIIRQIMEEQGVKYTSALRIYESRQKNKT